MPDKPAAGDAGRLSEENLFHLALDMAESERPAFLKAACGDDQELLTGVLELLEALQGAERRQGWQLPALENEAAATVVSGDSGEGFDGYEILDRIGAGGMGTVYRASRRDQQFSKTVALKIVHSSQPAVLERFYQERQIIAGLNHPNIAHLHDVGSTRDGVPFLVMEYVDGVPIDEFVRDRELGRREMLELFRKVCSAVSHAHGNLIVHRDLKPGNILVTPEGEPKLLDFGIAKLLDTGTQTKTGAGALTPEFASPEQITGGAITTTSDVYSLGVLLYLLLSGRYPYRQTTGPVDLAHAITAEAPQPLIGVAPDLTKVVQMALRKEPARRYRSVEQFSEDICRFLDGYPVAARPDSRTYRVTKFVGRHRSALIAAALILAAVLGGVAATVRQARIAERRFDDVRRLAHSYVFEVYDGLRDLPGSTALRHLVVKRALEYVDSLSKERGNDVQLSRELASTYFRVAQVQGAPAYPNLGDANGAFASARKALEIREKLEVSAPSSVEIGYELAETYELLGNLLDFQGDLSGAAGYLRKAVAVSEKMVATHPQSFDARRMLASNYGILANITGNSDFHNLGDWKGAGNYYRKALAIWEALATEKPADRNSRLSIAATCEKLASNARGQGDNPSAVQFFQRAIAISEALVAEDPHDSLYRRQIAVDSRSLSMTYLAQGKVDEARVAGDRANAIFEQAVKDDPNNVQAQEELADSAWSQGLVLEKADHYPAAFEHYGTAVAEYDRIRKEHPGLAPRGRRSAYQRIADLAARLGDLPRAIAAAQEEVKIDDEVLKTSPNDVSSRLNRGVAFLQIGQAYETVALKSRSAADWRQAVEWDRRSLDVWRQCQKDGVLNPAYATYLDRAGKAVERCQQALTGL